MSEALKQASKNKQWIFFYQIIFICFSYSYAIKGQQVDHGMLVKPLVFGVAGTKLSLAEKRLFKENAVYGFILFQRNIQNRKQLVALIKTLKKLHSNYQPKIFVDQEGGDVARLKPPIIADTFPPNAYFGKMYDKQGSKIACQAVYKNYAQIMQELKALAIDSPCAPVADLYYNYSNKVIGQRSFGSDVTKAIALCREAIKAIEDQGGIPIIKHMPGHGRATLDSHLALPYVTASCQELDQTDFKVFRALSKNNKAIFAMSAHIVFEAIDDKFPATLSSKVIQYIRHVIGFHGILISDAIEMAALHGKLGLQYQLVTKNLSVYETDPKSQAFIAQCIQQGVIHDRNDIPMLMQQKKKINADFTHSIVHATKQALKAGCDLVLHCNGSIEQMQKICQATEKVIPAPIH